jgi:hypothetical protein
MGLILVYGLTVGVVLTGLGLGWKTIRDPRHLVKGFLSIKELGVYEAQLPSLTRAIIVAHRIEAPKDSLHEAVKRNIKRGVKYTFLVSPSRYKENKELGFLYFETIAKMAIQEDHKDFVLSDVIEIRPLTFEWEDAPYIFYEVNEKDRPGVLHVLAVKGNQDREGIAEGYTEVHPASARTLHRAVVIGGARVNVDENIDEIVYGQSSVVADIPTLRQKMADNG